MNGRSALEVTDREKQLLVLSFVLTSAIALWIVHSVDIHIERILADHHHHHH